MKKLFYILFIFQINTNFAQSVIKNAETIPLALLQENEIISESKEVIFSLKGQIVFEGNSNNKNDILLTIDQGKFKSKLNKAISKSPTWIVQKEEIYWRKNREDFLIINIKQQDGFTSFYNANTDSLIAFVNDETINELQTSMVFFFLWQKLDLENKLIIKNIPEEIKNMPEGIIGYMKPVFGDPLNVWVWDGEILYHAYDNDPFYKWTFDGSTLKPQWNSRIETEWSWDGDELKPFWGGHPRNNWRWQGNTLRQVFENNYKNEYEIVDNIARKRFGTFGEIEWEIHGQMPLPIITIVLLGIVYRG